MVEFGPLAGTEWLAANLGAADLRIFDVTVFLHPNPEGRGYRVESGRERFREGHVPGAVFIDLIEDLSAPGSGLPFTMPPADLAAQKLAAAGIAADSRVVAYSTGSVMWATRLWWMLRSLGFDRAAVLDGGFAKWRSEGRPVTREPSTYPPATLPISPRPSLWAGLDEMRRVAAEGGACAVNALSPEVYRGEKNVYGRPGHIPGSHNVFYDGLLYPQSATFRPLGELRERFASSGALASPRVITYCGGGISATMDALALTLLGHPNVAVYDGSMSEWVRHPELPLKLGSEP
ncbi:MAG: sulfurtransferase [Deltaproteobacteria bacterium]|nr:sulfurtransferase [Deltaproteobacteria bacterium]